MYVALANLGWRHHRVPSGPDPLLPYIYTCIFGIYILTLDRDGGFLKVH